MINILNETPGEQENEDLKNQPEADQPRVGTFADKLATEDLDDTISLDDLPV